MPLQYTTLNEVGCWWVVYVSLRDIEEEGGGGVRTSQLFMNVHFPLINIHQQQKFGGGGGGGI